MQVHIETDVYSRHEACPEDGVPKHRTLNIKCFENRNINQLCELNKRQIGRKSSEHRNEAALMEDCGENESPDHCLEA